MSCFTSKAEAAEKTKVSEGSERFHSDRKAIWRGTLGHPEQRDIVKKVHNRKANCCTLLKRITNSKV